MTEQWEFQPTHEVSKDFAAINAIIERALASKSVEQKDQALREVRRFQAMNEATIGGFFDTHEGFIAALTRIRAITTNALPHNIDGQGEELKLIEAEEA